MVSETLLRDHQCKAQGLNASLDQQHEAVEDLSPVDDHGIVNRVHGYAMEFDWQAMLLVRPDDQESIQAPPGPT